MGGAQDLLKSQFASFTRRRGSRSFFLMEQLLRTLTNILGIKDLVWESIRGSTCVPGEDMNVEVNLLPEWERGKGYLYLLINVTVQRTRLHVRMIRMPTRKIRAKPG